jgi:hypothetical protein
VQELGWKRSDLVISTKIFWGGDGPNDKGLSRKHIIEGTKVGRLHAPPRPAAPARPAAPQQQLEQRSFLRRARPNRLRGMRLGWELTCERRAPPPVPRRPP